MKFYLLFIFLCLTELTFSQVFFDFESESLSDWQQSINGHWAASSDNPLNGNYSLHHIFDNPDAGHDQISYLYQQKIDMNNSVHWSFLVRHSYNPSSSNNWAIYLISDLNATEMVPDGQASGLVVGVNFIGSDDMFKLWKVEKGAATVILQSSINWEAKVGDSVALINIEKDIAGNYSLNLSVGGNKDKLTPIGNCFAPYNFEANYFGVYYKYSSAQDRKLWIDDIHIDANFITDTTGPIIDTAYVIPDRQIVVVFDEQISSSSINKVNLTLEKGNVVPDSIIETSGNSLKIFFHDSLPQGKTIWLTVSGIKDLKGNKMNSIDIGLSYYIPKAYDVLITEIMADPDPPVGLPNAEYIELYNRTDFSINLEKWQFVARNYVFTLPKIVIPKKDYAILSNCFGQKYFNDIAPSICWGNDYLITNTGTNLNLFDSLGYNIFSIVYSDDWYNDSYKKSGGWSLEMIDPENPCGGKDNWLPSIDKSGGTPGRQNSIWGINPDNSNPEFLYSVVPNDSNVILHFSEALNFETVSNSSNFFLDESIGYPSKISFENENPNTISLSFKNKLQTSKTYNLKIKKSVCDCVGNQILSDISLLIAIPQKADSFDVAINEVLFNAFPYGSEFVEIYNRSNKVIDAGSLILATLDTIDNTIKYFTKVAEGGYLMFPGSYLAVTGSLAGLEKFYLLKDKKAIIEQPEFPSLPDKNGIIVLVNKDYSVIDKFNYNEGMHFSQLSSKEGVSLERLNTNLPTQLSSNWHSASQTSGYATPGYSNSQAMDNSNIEGTGEVIISPQVFTPNNDGSDDVLFIKLNPNKPDCTATINIFNSSGRLIKHLLLKTSLSLVNSFTWDGTSDEHKVQSAGIYLIHIVLFSGKNDIKEIKRTCVLGYR